MKKLGAAMIVLAVLGYFYSGTPAKPTPTPAPAPTPAAVIPAELAAALQALELPARDRAVWAGMLLGIGRLIEADGKTSAPLFSTMADVESLRNAAVQVPVEPIAGGDKVGATIGPYVQKLGGPVDPLDPSRRAAVVQLLLGSAGALNGK